MVVSLSVIDQEACRKAGSMYRVVASIGEVSSNKKLTYTLAR